ncbi:RagB/SusD family nutrient uptake outer membrane protein [Chitinophaga sp. Cy-1792]|uniref:RagB/SusD family nutrient uptake outer membrane protein n=1 Tax=Chitinophaga sp. Cy-1792 TaxID=2608339 RepID=UPI0014233AA1|nr:RagB/SusD family nutrient uptake outer membrane protein [Chitinophaga sp. Cy-1792]NIG52290.1 RagB/SusD family nutrient uptake outer membrane protein [Chitinophaga sp. Cy-1792]
MKHISKYFAGLSLVMLAASCSLNKEPHQAVPNIDAKDPAMWQNATDGNYALLKEPEFTRNYWQIGEFPSDDIALSGTTTDPLFYSYTYGHLTNQGNTSAYWRAAYRAINGCNLLLAEMKEGTSADVDQMIGENLFIRAFVHHSLVRTFGRPYAQSPETNLGVPVVTTADITAKPKRNTVKEVYDQVIADLRKAKDLMTKNTDDRPNSYATKNVALAMLARVYLYKGQNDSAYIFADSVINSNRYSLITTDDLPKYYTKGNQDNKETIWAIHHTAQDDRDWSSIGSMYYTSPNGLGYGEIYASEAYRKLLDKYPQDARHTFVQPLYLKSAAGGDSTNASGKKVVATRGKAGGIQVEKWYITKFSNQDNIPTLSSPVVFRLAEMYLIRAEAAAKMGNNNQAIADVNTIRTRAGLSGTALFSTGDLKGYATVLDVVLDETRLELAFETHRCFDIFRNNRNLVRDYPGYHPVNPQTIEYTNARVVHYIPEQDILLNPNLVQNP